MAGFSVATGSVNLRHKILGNNCSAFGSFGVPSVHRAARKTGSFQRRNFFRFYGKSLALDSGAIELKARNLIWMFFQQLPTCVAYRQTMGRVVLCVDPLAGIHRADPTECRNPRRRSAEDCELALNGILHLQILELIETISPLSLESMIVQG